ncbi:hypothetical protein CHISP_3625 [Chitinispirillum alkaliphilum]|nr:hypothetical protein CHISP_3625 [Chitinispirillum alkaliphilum]
MVKSISEHKTIAPPKTGLFIDLGSDFNPKARYCNVNSTDQKLRFRPIPTVITGTAEPDGGYDMQWDEMHGLGRSWEYELPF